MLYRPGGMIVWDGMALDFLIVESEGEQLNALTDGWLLSSELRKPSVSRSPVDSRFDHNGDGRPGGSLPAEKRGLSALKEEAKAKGVKIDRRWGAKRILAEIAKVDG